MKLTKNKFQLYLLQASILSVLLVFALFSLGDEFMEEPYRKPDLPDFTRTYGFDVRPDVKLLNKNGKGGKKKASLKSLGNKLKKRLQKNKGENLQYGVQKFTQYTGKRRYGVGLKHKNEKNQLHNITLHGHGLSYERKKEKYKYYMGIDSRNPVDTKEEKESNYMYFGIKAKW